ATQLHAPRRCRCEPNGIIHPRLPPCAAKSPPTWPAPCPGVPAACEASYNTVVLSELGAILSCGRDAALIEGFNSDISLERPQTILGGASHCDFQYFVSPYPAEIRAPESLLHPPLPASS